MASITAPSLTLRSTKGSPLTNAEVDANFSNISTQIALGQTAASYTAADVLAKLITVDGAGSGLDADLLDGLNSATANTASTVVARDASGNFAAGTITAALAGNATTATDLQATLVVAKGVLVLLLLLLLELTWVLQLALMFKRMMRNWLLLLV